MKYFYALLFITTSFIGHSQTFGNEWIDFTQKYYSFDVTQSGVHKIDYNTLVAAGIPVSTITPDQFQIFGRDKELPLYMVDNNDNSFDSGDYFLFIAKKNNGWLDSILYEDPSTMGNPDASLISDTIHYFFSWKTSGTGLRYTQDTDTDFASYTPTNFVIKEISTNYFGEYFHGNVYQNATQSAYTAGEGYGSSSFVANPGEVVPLNMYMPSINKYSGTDAPNPIFEERVSSASGALTTGTYNHHSKMTIGVEEIYDSIWFGYKQMRHVRTLAHSTVVDGSTLVQLTLINDVGATLVRQGVTYMNLKYNRLLNSGGLSTDNFTILNQTSQSKSRLDLVNFNSSNSFAVYANGNSPRIQFGTINAGTHQFLVPNNSSSDRTYIEIYDYNQSITVGGLSPVNGTGNFVDYSLNVQDSMLLIVTSEIYTQGANNYKNYRESIPGGAYPTTIAFYTDLCDQFGGGIPLHPAAIRRYVHYMYSLANVKPAALFLVGKGIDPLEHRLNSAVAAQNLVPTLGNPGSDIALTARLEETIFEPLVPTGRISVTDNTQLQNYLEKVIEYDAYQVISPSNFETTQNSQKQILHFVGGATLQQQATFQDHMNQMKATIEDSLYAGNVISYFKTSSDPLDPTVVAGVSDIISSGVSLMTFFGHAAQSNNGFEINIDEPANWNNVGKYPIVIGNSCHNGNIFITGTNSTSERFVNTVQEGAIAFVSSVGLGFDYPLSKYSKELYKQFSNKNYGKPFGYQIQQTIKDIQSATGQDLLTETTYHQMALNGDPLIKLNYQRKPEISIKANDISFSPSIINLTTDSIAVQFTVKNLGMSIDIPIQIEITRDFPQSNIDSTLSFTIPSLNYDTIITKKFPLQPEISAGINQFTISVDIPSFIDEEFEENTNNTASANLFVPISGINPIWPYNYAVVPYDTVTVKASTINPIASLKTYRFQLDTTDTYDSPQFRTFSVTELGGVKCVPYGSWLNAGGTSFPLVCEDSTVYFWRVAVDSSILNWTEFSFQYIEGKTGWGQDHFFQFKNNSFTGIDYNRTTRTRDFFIGQGHTIFLRAFENIESWDNQWGLDGSYFDYASVLCDDNPGIYVGVLDPITLQPWYTAWQTENPDHVFGQATNAQGYCNRTHRVEGYFAFDQDNPAHLAAFENMIENEIPNGHYVVIYTVGATEYSNWTALQPSLYNMFTDLGSTLVNNTQPEKPFGMIFRKGDPASLVEKHFPDTISTGAFTSHVYVEMPITESSYIGVEKTPLIGPAFEWQSLFWKRDSTDLITGDSLRIRIEKYDINQALQVTTDTLFTPNDSIINLASVVDANQFPYIRLNIYNQDGVNFTPGQIDRLHVLFAPVPEAAIDGTASYFFDPSIDILAEGQDINFAVDVRNVSDYDMDSLLIEYKVEDANHIFHTIPYVRQAPLLSGQVLRDTITFSTLNYPGYNGLWMEVNPYINGSLYQTDQLEQYHFNNLLYIPFRVDGDDEHPILDVTFDGRHILNGDIVSPESEILITLKDENPYLVMDNVSDTTHFGVYLTDPTGAQKRIPFIDGSGNTIMQWFPAEPNLKKFKILYPTDLLMDGKYTLLVQGSDRTGNISGDFEYRVTFEVIRESSITYLMNYPNPFSTSTRFVFTLTGTQEPEEVIIQVMTVTGRVVREITEDELGKVYIGRNISEFAWDGTDEFGDKLANGVYLYRVKAKINGEDIKHRESGADDYFKEEFGKMYLMR